MKRAQIQKRFTKEGEAHTKMVRFTDIYAFLNQDIFLRRNYDTDKTDVFFYAFLNQDIYGRALKRHHLL